MFEGKLKNRLTNSAQSAIMFKKVKCYDEEE